MTPTQVILTLAGAILIWYSGWAMQAGISSDIIRNLEAEIELLKEKLQAWEQHSIETETELRSIYKGMKEQEEKDRWVTKDAELEAWKKLGDKNEKKYQIIKDNPDAVIGNDNSWKLPENLKDLLDEDIDYRIPGQHQP